MRRRLSDRAYRLCHYKFRGTWSDAPRQWDRRYAGEGTGPLHPTEERAESCALHAYAGYGHPRQADPLSGNRTPASQARSPLWRRSTMSERRAAPDIARPCMPASPDSRASLSAAARSSRAGQLGPHDYQNCTSDDQQVLVVNDGDQSLDCVRAQPGPFFAVPGCLGGCERNGVRVELVSGARPQHQSAVGVCGRHSPLCSAAYAIAPDGPSQSGSDAAGRRRTGAHYGWDDGTSGPRGIRPPPRPARRADRQTPAHRAASSRTLTPLACGRARRCHIRARLNGELGILTVLHDHRATARK